MRRHARSQLIALTRAFFARFFENEIAGGTGDLKTTFFWLLSFLAAPGFLVPILIVFAGPWTPDSNPADWGWTMVARYQGIEALRALSLNDKTLYLGFAIAAAGGLSAMVWNSLLPDRRDALVLGALPVRPAIVVFARLLALAGYVGIVAVGMNLLASVSFGALLAAGNTFTFAIRGIGAHFIASVSVSFFVFLTIAGFQGLVLVLGGTRVFARVSPILQMTLVALVAIDLLTLPTLSGAAGDAVRGAEGASSWVLGTPALWFLGVYEQMLGTANPTLIRLATVAVQALTTMGALVLVVYPLAYRRLMVASVEQGEYTNAPRRGALAPLVAAVTSRDATVRALSEFFLTTIARVDRHRFVMAASFGVAIAWSTAAAMALRSDGAGLPRIDLLSVPLFALVFVLAGMRIAAAIPSTLPPAWMFENAAPTPRQGRTALERTMAVVVVLPIVLGSAALVGWWWGRAAAIVHAAMLMAVSYVVIQTLVWRFAGVPCTEPWAPERVNLRKWWPAYLVVFVALTSGMAGFEWVFLTAIVAPESMPSLANVLSLAVPLTVGAIVGVGRLVRDTALHSLPSGDDGDLRVLTDALQRGRWTEDQGPSTENWTEDRALRTKDHSTDLQRRGPFSLVDVPSPDEDRWFDGFDLRPGELWRDVRLACRRLGRTPAFAVFAAVTLALGIGVTTATFSLVTAVASRPMDIRDPDSVVAVRSQGRYGRSTLSWLDFQDLRAQQTTFSALEAQSEFPASLTGNGPASVVNGQLVTGGYFDMLDIQAAIGRTIEPADDRPDSPLVVVLSESAWRTRFGRDPAIVGQDARIGGQAYRIVGVLPRAFRGLDVRAQQPAVWVPLAHPPLTDPGLTVYRDPGDRARGYLRVVARLRMPGSQTAAESEVAAVGQRLDRDAPVGPARFWAIEPVTENQWVRASQVYGAIVVALPILVLLIACTNLANLVLSRNAARRHELAVRRALGASRWSLVRAQVVEHGLVAAVGAAGGVMLAHALLTYVVSFVQRALGYAPQYQVDPQIDLTALTVAAAATVLAVLVAGLAPAVRLTRDGPGRVLGNHEAGTISSRWQGQRTLLAGQVAASLALLLVAALCLRQSFAIAREEGARGDLAGVAAVTVALPLRTHDEARVDEIAQRILAEARRAGGLVAAAVSTGLNGAGASSVDTTTVDRPFAPTTQDPTALMAASPEMFRVLGVRFLSGHAYGDEHTGAGPGVAVINESEARALFGTVEAAGRDLLIRSRTGAESEVRVFSVLGVVTDGARNPRTGDLLRNVYVPFAQRAARDLNVASLPVAILARSASGDAASAAARLRIAVSRADADLAVTFGGPASALAGGPGPIFGLVVQSTTALALLALALSMSGLYSVMSHLVSSRTRELGIRAALGADRWSIIRLVITDGARPVAQGLGIGLVTAAIVRMAMQPLFRASSSAVDPVAVAIAVVPLAVAAAVACYLPARRAASVDPNVALRHL